MSLLPYPVARAFLFGLDPEAAHDLSMNALAASQRSPLKAAYAQKRVDDPVRIAGLSFPNRVGLAAGLDKNARCIDAWDAMGFGFVEVGTVTPLPQSGNPKPRMFRLPKQQALINRLGFNNEGLGAFVQNIQRSQLYRDARGQADPSRGTKPKARMILGLNIGKNAITPIECAAQDYVSCLGGVYPYADYISVNISSPNTQNLRSLQSDEALDGLLGAIAQRRAELAQEHGVQKPIFLKIAPDLNDAQIKIIAWTLQKHEIDGVIATNTTLARDGVKGLKHAQEAGGLSGAPVLSASNAVIAQLRQALGKAYPIIGVGGVLSGEDALSKLQAGADLVQIYTGMIYKGPGLVGEVARALAKRAT